MEFLKTVFGELAWPLVLLFLFALVGRTVCAIIAHMNRHLLVLLLSLFAASAMATETPYQPSIPSDVLGEEIGEWTGSSTLLGELKLIRDLLTLQVKVTVMFLGVIAAHVAISQIRPR